MLDSKNHLVSFHRTSYNPQPKGRRNAATNASAIVRLLIIFALFSSSCAFSLPIIEGKTYICKTLKNERYPNGKTSEKPQQINMREKYHFAITLNKKVLSSLYTDPDSHQHLANQAVFISSGIKIDDGLKFDQIKLERERDDGKIAVYIAKALGQGNSPIIMQVVAAYNTSPAVLVSSSTCTER